MQIIIIKFNLKSVLQVEGHAGSDNKTRGTSTGEDKQQTESHCIVSL